MYEVRLRKRFKKQFRKLDEQIQRKVIEEIELLKTNPEIGDKLKGVLSDFRRIRIHDYRLVYQIRSSDEIVEVFFVDHRKRVYRELERLKREELI